MLLSLFDSLKPSPAATDEPALKQQFEIEVKGEQVAVRIMFENRLNNRVSVSKNGILLRISERQTREEQRKNIDQLLKWAKERLGDKPELLDSIPQRKYINGEVLRVGDYEFVISIFYHDLPKSTAKIHKNNILISLTKGLIPEVEANTCSYLVSKCLCRFFQPVVAERLNELNERHFKKQIQQVTLKYATSYWGHCSNNGNIVISVRLMFAPQRVIDYVLIHELAHLVHHNHTPRFWRLVESAMPDYKQAEKHLSEQNLRYYL